jgi:diadenosine tetraphosphate (Ap4A) HIT family hydrolase
LRVTPDTAYNIGVNVGGYAGQSVDHLHVQIFPRRDKGLGIVTMAKEFFNK